MKSKMKKVTMFLMTIFIVYCTHAADLSGKWNFREIIIDENPLQPHRITDIEIVHIDNDGRLDIWCSGSKIRMHERKSAWYQNTGDMNNWQRHTPFPGPSLGAKWADIDGDGDMDLITGQDRNWAKTGNYAFVWMENPLKEGGDPAVDIWKTHEIEPDPQQDPDEVKTTFINAEGKVKSNLDLNNDGRCDVVVAAFKETLWYYPGPESPQEGPWKKYLIAKERHGHGGAEIADLDNDNDLDIVWGHSWFENTGDPTKVPWPRHVIDPNWPNECKIAIADLNKDGYLDVVLTGEENDIGVAWFANPGSKDRGKWKKHIIIAGWKGLHSCQVADFDLDGDIDIFTAQMHKRPGQRIAIIENIDITSNKWRPHVISRVGSHNAKIGDIDGDGDIDIVGKNYEEDFRPRLWLNPHK